MGFTTIFRNLVLSPLLLSAIKHTEMSHKYYNEGERSFVALFVQFHMLIKQHLNGKELARAAEFDDRTAIVIRECDACMDEICLKIDIVDVPKLDEFKYVLRTKRNYRNMRLMGYNSREVTQMCIKVLEVLGESVLHLELYDMRVDADTEELKAGLPNIRSIKVSAFNGDYQFHFLQPYYRYESLSFENMNRIIDLKVIGEFDTACRNLNFKNCKVKDWEMFDYYDGYCRKASFECNHKSDLADLCRVLKRSSEIKELTIEKKTTFGYCLRIHREIASTSKPSASVLLARKPTDDPDKNEPSGPLRLDEDEILEHLNKINLNQMYQRRSISSDESIDSFKTAGETTPEPTEKFYNSKLELYDLSWLVLMKVGASMPQLTCISIHVVDETVIARIFATFKGLQTLIMGERREQREFSREKFPLDEFPMKGVKDPMMKLSPEFLSLCLQHLEFDDFISASLVSTRWNQILGESESFMAKTILKLNASACRRNVDLFCKNSSRLYQHLEMNCQKDPNFSLRSVELIHAVSSSLVELKLSDCHLLKISSFKDRLVFDKLKRMELHLVDNNTCFLLLQNSLTLESLKISSMPFTEEIIERIRNNLKLKDLALYDCTFDYFESLKIPDDDRDKMDLNLRKFTLIFERANAWKIQESEGFKKFVRIFAVITVEHFVASGVRGNFLFSFMLYMREIREVQIMHEWESDLTSNNFRMLRYDFTLRIPALTMGQNVDWLKYFPMPSTLYLGQEEFRDLDRTDKTFKKMLKSSAEKLIQQRMYASQKKIVSFFDPMVKIAGELHQLIFQHFRGGEFFNFFEVSKTWNNICKQSKYGSRKYCLYIKESFNADDKKIIAKSSRKYLNLICDVYQPQLITNFSNLKKLSLRFTVPGELNGVTFVKLETLIIQKCPGNLYKPEVIKECFRVFANCSELRCLEIYESITSENVEYIKEMLVNNTKLKILKLHPCSEFYRLFSEDLSQKIQFKLARLYYAIPEKFVVYETKFEANVCKFLITQSTLKILDLNNASAEILNTINRNLPNLETLRLARITRTDHVKLQKHLSIKEFLLPNTPQLMFINATNKGFDFHQYIDAIPNCEFLFIYNMNKEICRYVVENLWKLKVLSYDRVEGQDCEKFYRRMQVSSLVLNRKVKIHRVEYRVTDNDERSYDRLFGSTRE